MALIVTSAPDILYLKDTNGDLRADLRQVLFTGFSMGDPEARITNLRFGIDNWIYASNHGQPGTIASPAFPEAPPVSVLGTDFRFRMDRGRFEAASGTGQFGLAIDDWGHRFITQNTIHVRPRRHSPAVSGAKSLSCTREYHPGHLRPWPSLGPDFPTDAAAVLAESADPNPPAPLR